MQRPSKRKTGLFGGTRKFPPGKTFFGVIKAALDAAKCVVVLWSKQSIHSEWVLEEANMGKRRAILVPAKIDSVEPPLGFGLHQAADLTDWDGDPRHAEFEGLLTAISDIVGTLRQGENSDQVADLSESSLEQPSEAPREEGEIPQSSPRQPASATAEPAEPQADATVATDPKLADTIVSEPQKTSNVLKFGILVGVAVLLIPEKQPNGLYTDPIFDAKQRWCWSADKGSSGSAWSVDFHFGSVDWYYLDSNDYVRVVRS